MSEILPVFVYGTLRVGEGNFEWIQDCVVEYDQDVTAFGHIWFYHSIGSYPVAKFAQTTDTIKGDVLWCNSDHRMYERMVAMEVGAGYEFKEIEVVLSNGVRQDVMGFHWLGTPRSSLYIEHGDWRAAMERLDELDIDELHEEHR